MGVIREILAHDIAVYWTAVFLASLLLSMRQVVRAWGDFAAERALPDTNAPRRWVALEFMVTGGLGFVGRAAFMVGGLLVIGGTVRVIDRDIARYWPQVLCVGATFLLAINVWQEIAHTRLRGMH